MFARVGGILSYYVLDLVKLNNLPTIWKLVENNSPTWEIISLSHTVEGRLEAIASSHLWWFVRNCRIPCTSDPGNIRKTTSGDA